MNREKKLLKNTMILTAGNILTKLITFFLLPLYTRFLTVEEYGLVDLLNTLISLLLPIITFQIEQGVFRRLIDLRKNNSEDLQNSYISTGFYSILENCFFFAVIFVIVSFFIHSQYKYYLALNLVAFIFASYFQQVSRGYGDNKRYAISSVVAAIITIISSVILLVPFKLGAPGMLVSTLLGQIGCIIYLVVVLKLYRVINFSIVTKEQKKELFKYSIPLIPNSISWWVFNASDRLIVTIILGLSSAGILAAAHKFPYIYISVYNIFHLGWIESVSEHIKDTDFKAYFNKMFNSVVFLFISFNLTIIAFMPIIYYILIDRKFEAGFNLVPIGMLGAIFNMILAVDTAVYVAEKNTKAIANTATVSAIINVIVHLCLIKFIGLYAAMISTALAYLTLCIFRHRDISKKYFKVKFESKKAIISIIVTIIVFILYYLKAWYYSIAMIIIVLIYDFIVNRKQLKEMIKMVTKKKSNIEV